MRSLLQIMGMHFWAVENPHWLHQVQHRQWSVNLYCGIVEHRIVGPYFIDGRLNGRKYKRFLRRTLPVLMEDLPLNLRQVMWYQHGGCTAHNVIVARNALNQQFPKRWIGRCSPVQRFPARSPDLTPLDCFLWGHMKNVVYQQVPATMENTKERITAACAALTQETLTEVGRSMMMPALRCCEANGHPFEHELYSFCFEESDCKHEIHIVV